MVLVSNSWIVVTVKFLAIDFLLLFCISQFATNDTVVVFPDIFTQYVYTSTPRMYCTRKTSDRIAVQQLLLRLTPNHKTAHSYSPLRMRTCITVTAARSERGICFCVYRITSHRTACCYRANFTRVLLYLEVQRHAVVNEGILPTV